MKRIILFFFPFFIVTFLGCSHTNELAKYNLRGQNFIFKDFISNDASRINIVTNDYSSQSDTAKSDAEEIISTIASVGSDIITENAKEKLENSVNTEYLVGYISEGLENALKTYLEVQIVSSINDNPQFIVETTLDECKLIVQKNGTYVNVNAKCEIIDRATGNTVWDNREIQTVPINQDYRIYKESSRLENKIFNAVQLTSLSEEELNQAIGRAAEKAGFEMGKTLREDLAEINKK